MISAASDDEAITLMGLHAGDYIPNARKLTPGGPDTITRALPVALKKKNHLKHWLQVSFSMV